MATMDKLLTEMLRPKKVEDMVLPARIRTELEQGLVQNMLLYSTTPGSGKSTSARILCANHDTLRLNGSSENGIDVIRNQVIQFAATLSLEDGEERMKVIYIDEADGLSDAAWDALRETIERFADSVRFVCTCNKIDKIPVPIRSRFKCIPFFPQTKEEEQQLFADYCAYIARVLVALKISYDQETLAAMVKQSFPDMRSIINMVQSLYIQDIHVLDKDSFVKTYDCHDLFEVLVAQPDPVSNYTFVTSNYGSNPDDAMRAIGKGFIDYLRNVRPDLCPKIPFIIIAIADYMQMMVTIPDKLVALLACCAKIQTIINK